MQVTRSIPDSVEATLDEVSRLHALRTDAEAGLFVLAAAFADQHSGDSLAGSWRALPGLERSVRVGGVGTPSVAEFAFAELGARMQMSPWSARRLVADALDVRGRLPLIWARVVARRARVSNARLVAARTRHLSVAAAGVVDAAMVGFVDGSLPWGRFETRLAGRIVAADPAAAAAREEAAAREQFARRTRSSEAGIAGFYVRSTVGVIARLDATVAFLADALAAFGDPDVEELRRVKAVALLANPVRAVELLAAFAAHRADTPATASSPSTPGFPLTPGSPSTPEPCDGPAGGARRCVGPDGCCSRGGSGSPPPGYRTGSPHRIRAHHRDHEPPSAASTARRQRIHRPTGRDRSSCSTGRSCCRR